jgi:ATP-dependent 26S proteasome regulatory subunit
VCALNKQREHKRKYRNNNRNEEKEKERKQKYESNRQRKSNATTTYVPGKITEEVDWDAEIIKIKKLKKATYSDSYMHKPEYYD